MNTILMSIRPEYLVKILNHDKTIEVRKSIPLRFKPPFKVVMYCTKSKGDYLFDARPTLGDNFFTHCCKNYFNLTPLNGFVVGEFICDKVERIQQDHNGYIKNDIELLHGACLTVAEFTSYVDYKLRLDNGVVARNLGYALHISNVVAYGKPKEIGKFFGLPNKCDVYAESGKPSEYQRLTRAPQSWQYIEVEK